MSENSAQLLRESRKNSQITFGSTRVWLLKTAEWRTHTSKFPVQLHWARAHKCNSGLPDDRWTQSSEDKQMFWERDLISGRDQTPPHAQNRAKTHREMGEKQKERGRQKERGEFKGDWKQEERHKKEYE